MMRRPLVILSPARSDIAEAVRFLNQQRPGHGDELALELRRVFGFLEGHPELYQSYLRGSRRAILRRFNYAVVYRERRAAVEVVAVMHCRMGPKHLKARAAISPH